MDRAQRWLYGRRLVLRQWRRDDPGGGVEELLERALAGVGALELAGVLSHPDAASWRDRLHADAGGDAPRSPVSSQARRAADGLLEELLHEVPAGLEDGDLQLERFEGALELLAAIGAVDAAAWDERLRRRLGWPSEEEENERVRELNAGGTEVELLAVLPGPVERRGGRRVVVALRYADGVSLVVDKEPPDTSELEWPEWRLSDDRGTQYWTAGGAGGDTDEHVTFRPAPPLDARWVELALEGHPDATFRVAL